MDWVDERQQYQAANPEDEDPHAHMFSRPAPPRARAAALGGDAMYFDPYSERQQASEGSRARTTAASVEAAIRQYFPGTQYVPPAAASAAARESDEPARATLHPLHQAVAAGGVTSEPDILCTVSSGFTRGLPRDYVQAVCTDNATSILRWILEPMLQLSPDQRPVLALGVLEDAIVLAGGLNVPVGPGLFESPRMVQAGGDLIVHRCYRVQCPPPASLCVVQARFVVLDHVLSDKGQLVLNRTVRVRLADVLSQPATEEQIAFKPPKIAVEDVD